MYNPEKLRQKRLSKSVYQKELAEVLDISLKQYSFKELGKNEFTRSEIEKISLHLNLSSVERDEIFF